MINELSYMGTQEKRQARDIAASIVSSAYSADPKYAESSNIIARGLSLVKLDKVQVFSKGHAIVASGTQPDKSYQISSTQGCECKYAEIHGASARCSHRWAAALQYGAVDLLKRMHRASYKGELGFTYDLGISDDGHHRVAFFPDNEQVIYEISRFSRHLVLGGNVATMMIAPKLDDHLLYREPEQYYEVPQEQHGLAASVHRR